MPTAATPVAQPPRIVAYGMLLLGSVGAAAIWTLLNLFVDRLCAWMAVMAAVDMVLLLRFVRTPTGPARAGIALAGTLLAIALANWWIAGGQIGKAVGLEPWEAIPRLGSSHGWQLITMANDGVALVWYLVAVVIAAWFGR